MRCSATSISPSPARRWRSRAAGDREYHPREAPDDFQRSEYLYNHGLVDRIVPRGELRHELARLIDYLAPEARAA